MITVDQKRHEVRQRLVEENEFPNIPENWSIERLRFLFSESKERNGKVPVGEMLSVSEYHGVIPREYEHEEQKRTEEELENYRVVRPGQLAVNSMWLNHLGLGVSDHIGHVSPAYNVYDLSYRLDRRFAHHLMRSNYYLKIYLRYLYGIRPNSFQIKSNDWASIPIIVPDLPTQRAIADFLDRETARIDSLIEKKQQLVDMIAPRFEALIHVARETGDWRRFGYSAQTTMRPIPLSSGAAYVPLGLYNRGRGFFQKPETAYDDLGDSSFCFVRKGDLVFSGQFAWEGAVGLVSDKEHDCVVSHRYPVYTGIEGILSEYLFAYFRSHHGQFLMDNCSRGAAGRNRPLNTRILEKEKIPVPSIELQKQVATLIKFERRLKDKTSPSIDRLNEYRSALITSAVTGQIDVSTYSRSGTTERQLDAIQAEMS